MNALTYTGDLYPTLCDLLDLPIPPTVETQSLLPLLDDAPEPGRNSVCTAYKDVQRAAVEDRWKLIRYYRAGGASTGTPGEDRVQLFDLDNDPWELHDLFADRTHSSHVERLANTLAEWQRWSGDPLAGTPVLPG